MTDEQGKCSGESEGVMDAAARALAELVRLEDLKNYGWMGNPSRQADYDTNLPKAWATARAVLAVIQGRPGDKVAVRDASGKVIGCQG